MHRIFMAMRSWLERLAARPCPPDPLLTMSPRELADLPAVHPARDSCGC
ncbi:MAG TPA: hypothetical protein GYA10_09090 [Alphaproteobacteria bacterium]|nr:hypothetical protein [Alphaproteobacteria bacterium]